MVSPTSGGQADKSAELVEESKFPTPQQSRVPQSLVDQPHRSGASIHPMTATLLLAVDNLWNFADWAVIDWFITIPASFVTVFVPSLVIQRFARRDPWLIATAKSFVLAVIAAVPTSLAGTPVGIALLAWAGIRRGK